MEILKIAIAGAVGAGKTSFVRAISEIDVVDTERYATDETALLKLTTTVAFDFGRLTLNSGQILHLYGTPGQFRFDFMWDILLERVHAYIFLVNAHRPQDLRASRRILNFMKLKTQMPMIIGLTHRDCQGAWQADDIALALGLSNSHNRPKIIDVNANESQSVAQCLVYLVEQLMLASNSESISHQSKAFPKTDSYDFQKASVQF
jgi:signal recognition particle receptor subunit beta